MVAKGRGTKVISSASAPRPPAGELLQAALEPRYLIV
jgi:hypothetical protein